MPELPAALPPTPASAVDLAGRAQFGIYRTPFEHLNLEETRISTLGVPWSRGMRRFRLKRWQHVWLVTDELYFGMAAVNAGHLKTAFAYAVDRASGDFAERKWEGLRPSIHIPPTLWDSRGHFRTRGYRIEFRNYLREGFHEYRLDADAHRGTPAIRAKLVVHEDLESIQPLVAVMPMKGGRALYTHKCVAPVSGEVKVGDRSYGLNRDHARAILDVHRAHYPYRTWWKWATFWGKDSKGREVGINLQDGVLTQPDEFNECAFWLEGKMYRLALGAFTPPKRRYTDPWTIGTTDGRVRLFFQPEGERHGRVEAGLAASNFHQPYGVFRGEVDLPGETIHIPAAWGVAENHTTRW